MSEGNPYTIPGMVLAACVLGALGLAASSNKKVAAAADAAAMAEQAKENLSFVIEAQRTSKAAAETNARPVDLFMNQWARYLTVGADTNAILGDISRIANEQTVSVQGRRSTTNDVMWKGEMVPVNYAEGTAVSSEFFRLTNWLGLVEKQWPLVRFERIEYEQTGGTLKLSVKTAYPLFIMHKLSATE